MDDKLSEIEGVRHMALARAVAGFLGLGLALGLVGCQPLPLKPSIDSQAVQASASKASPTQAIRADRRALDLRVFLADISPRPGWVQVNLNPQGVLYVMTEAVITRRDLIGIQSGTDNKSGDGILIVTLSDAGFAKIRAATAAYPGLRLALVVGKTMLAAPGYTAPISEKQLAFRVGSRLNADKAARAVAGVDDPAESGL